MYSTLVKNASFNTLVQVVYAVLSILFVPFFISKLSIAGYGVYCFINLFLTWVTIFQLGMEPTLINLTSKYYAKSEFDSINNIVCIAALIQLLIGIVIAAIIWVFSELIISIIIKDKIEYLNDGSISLKLAAINIIIIMSKNVFSAIFKGLQRYDISSSIDIVFNLFATLAAAFMVLLGYGITGMIAGRLAINVLFFIITIFAIRQTFSFFKINFRHDKSILKEMMDFGSWIVVGRLNRLVINALPPLFIGKFIGPGGIGYFNIALKIFMTLNNLLSSAVNVIFPKVSELKFLNEKNQIKNFYLTINKYLSFLSAPIYIFLGIFSWRVLNVWLGTETADNCWLLMLSMSIGYYLTSSTMVPTNFALGLGNSKLLALNGLLQVIVIVLVLPFLLRSFGVVGAGVNVISFELVSVGTGIYITKKLVKASAFQYWVKDRIAHYFIGLSIYFPLLIINYLFPLQLNRHFDAAIISGIFIMGLILYVIFTKILNFIDLNFVERFTGILNRK